MQISIIFFYINIQVLLFTRKDLKSEKLKKNNEPTCVEWYAPCLYATKPFSGNK